MLSAVEELGAQRERDWVRPVGKTRIAMGTETQVLALMEWARVQAGLSPAALGRALGVKAQTIGAYRERKRRPGVVMLVRWLEACGYVVEAVQR